MPPCPTAFWPTETRSHAKRNISVVLTAILVLFAAFLLQIGAAFGEEKFELPKAIQAEKDWALHSAWFALEKGAGNIEYKLYGIDYARAIMRLDSNAHVGTQFNKVTEETMRTSPAFYLLAAKMNRMGGWLWRKYELDQKNPALSQFGKGLGCLYGHENDRARQHFANGMFIAAHLDRSFYDPAYCAWDAGAGMRENALRLAKVFVDVNLEMKEIILKNTIARKFQHTKGDPKATNIDSDEYRLKMAYWNLGFFILANYNSGNKDEALKLRNTNGYTYDLIFNKYKFDTADNKLT